MFINEYIILTRVSLQESADPHRNNRHDVHSYFFIFYTEDW